MISEQLKRVNIIYIAILFLLLSVNTLAQPSTRTEIVRLAMALADQPSFSQSGTKGAGDYSIAKIDSIVFNGITIGYRFNYNPQGFAVIPKDKSINPFFAFSNLGSLSSDPNDFISGFLRDELVLRHRALKGRRLSSELISKNQREWKKYQSVKGAREEVFQYPPAGSTTTGGLIRTTWTQDGPYDDSCPVDPATGLTSLTGCVATALAQVVNYWGELTGYPRNASFTSSDNYISVYEPGDAFGTRQIPIDATTASFSGFNYPLTPIDAAKLSYACGISVSMNYTSAASSASTAKAVDGLLNKFGFRSAEYLAYNQNFTKVLYNNIERGQPCILAISKTGTGHAIICDGVIDDGNTFKFHLNYGWEGAYGTLFYEIPSELPADFTSIKYGVVNISYEEGIFDADLNFYKTVKVGANEWITENLRTTKYNDNTEIQFVAEPASWGTLSTPAYSWYENDGSANKMTYGALYNWYSVNSGRLCPSGFHVPDSGEWEDMAGALGGAEIAGGKLKETGTTYWSDPNTGATNESGFSALPGGFRSSDGSFSIAGVSGLWWNNDFISSDQAQFHSVGFDNSSLLTGVGDRRNGLSVRCVKDISPALKHFIPVTGSSKGKENINLYIFNAVADGSDLKGEDEIGIFDNGICIGAGILTQVLSGPGYLKVSITPDDPNTPEKDGFTMGDPITYKFWNAGGNREISPVQAVYFTGFGFFHPGISYSLNLSAISSFTLKTKSFPAHGGTTSGDGTYEFESNVMLSAFPNTGFSFINWTEDDVEISRDPSFNMSLNKGRVLVAHFDIATESVAQNSDRIEIFPNPVRDILTVSSSSENQLSVEILDIHGNLQLKSSERSIDLSQYKPGLYLVKVNGKVSRIIKE